MSWLDWAAAAVGGYYAYTHRDEISKNISDGLDSLKRLPEEMRRMELQDSNKVAGETTERVIDESELPVKVRRYLSAEEQKEKLLDEIAIENNAAKRTDLIKQLKALN